MDNAVNRVRSDINKIIKSCLVFEVLISADRYEIAHDLYLPVLAGAVQWRCVTLLIESQHVSETITQAFTLFGESTTRPMLMRYLTTSRWPFCAAI